MENQFAVEKLSNDDATKKVITRMMNLRDHMIAIDILQTYQKIAILPHVCEACMMGKQH